MVAVSHDTYDQVHHAGRDSYGRPLVAGATYFLSRPGKPTQSVTVVEDPSTSDLSFDHIDTANRKVRMRVEECSVDCIFSRACENGQDPDFAMLDAIDQKLREAASARQELASVERSLCSSLGCSAGDGSHLWDAISAAVRDGMGTPCDLAQLSSGEA